MVSPAQLTSFIAQLPLYSGALALIVAGVLALVMAERRLALLLLLIQYAAVALLSRRDLYLPIVLVRLATGCVVCGLLFMSAQRAQRARLNASRAGADGSSPLTATLVSPGSGGMSLAFRIVLGVLSVLLALGIWQRYPFYNLLQGYGFALLVASISGILMILASPDPLRRGIGLLMLLNGAGVAYLYLQQSFLVIMLMDALDVMIALAIAHLAESWLNMLEGGSTP